MNRVLLWKLAFRYLRGKRSANAVPILSRISMVAIAVCSGAMIVVFSVFNGLQSLVKDMYKAFYPDIKITAVKGKFFKLDGSKLNEIRHWPGVLALSPVIEDNVFANNSDQQKIITLKGIENSYFDVNDVRDYIAQGDDTVSAGLHTAIAGLHIMSELGAGINAVGYLMLYYPNPAVTNISSNPLSAIQTLKLRPAGIFEVGDEPDNKYILASLPLVQTLFNQEGRYSSVEIKVTPKAVDDVKSNLQHLLGGSYKVETRYEQNRTIYMVMEGEKWAIYAILLLVLLIASFNMVGALAMLVLEKQKDIGILRAMGADAATIKKIFFVEGMLWSLVGGVIGIILGDSLCLLQQKTGLLKIGSAFVVDSYPVQMELQDVGLVITTILVVGLLASWYPAVRATKTIDVSLKST
jgi:lipoprotein-releasing system permease protein